MVLAGGYGSPSGTFALLVLLLIEEVIAEEAFSETTDAVAPFVMLDALIPFDVSVSGDESVDSLVAACLLNFRGAALIFRVIFVFAV